MVLITIINLIKTQYCPANTGAATATPNGYDGVALTLTCTFSHTPTSVSAYSLLPITFSSEQSILFWQISSTSYHVFILSVFILLRVHLITCLSYHVFILSRVHLITCSSYHVFILSRVHLISVYLITCSSYHVFILSRVHLIICSSYHVLILPSVHLITCKSYHVFILLLVYLITCLSYRVFILSRAKPIFSSDHVV